MSGYVGTLTQMLVLNTASDTRRTRSSSRLGAGSRRSWSVSPGGLSIAQRQAQLAANIASTAASDVGRVATTADATRNVTQQAVETVSHAAESAGQSRAHARKLFDTLQDELLVKFDEDRIETRLDADRLRRC